MIIKEGNKEFEVFDVQWFAVRTRDGWERKVCDAILSKAVNLEMEDRILDACVVYDTVPKKKAKTTERKKKVYRSEFDIGTDPIVDAYINFTEDELQAMREEEEKKYEYTPAEEVSVKGYVYVKLSRVQEDEKNKNGEIIGKVQKITNGTWQAIRNVTGVMGIYSQMNIPVAISKADVAKLRLEDPSARTKPGHVVRDAKKTETAPVEAAPVKALFDVGDTVIVKEGAYTGTPGQVTFIDLENNVVKLDISFFGRSVSIEIAISSVEKV